MVFFNKNNITIGQRYFSVQHQKGGAVYALAYFQNILSLSLSHVVYSKSVFLSLFVLVSAECAIFTVLKAFHDMPHCLRIAFDYYMGFNTVVCLLMILTIILPSLYSIFYFFYFNLFDFFQQAPPPMPCDIKYCHCKMLHLPLFN